MNRTRQIPANDKTTVVSSRRFNAVTGHNEKQDGSSCVVNMTCALPEHADNYQWSNLDTVRSAKPLRNFEI